MNCEQNQQAMEIKTNIRKTYSWLAIEDIDKCYDMALSDYLSIKYPSENSRPTPNKMKFDFINSQWIYKRMLDILGRAGGLSAVAYKENNLSWSYGASFIDPQLVAELMPKAGVPR